MSERGCLCSGDYDGVSGVGDIMVVSVGVVVVWVVFIDEGVIEYGE